MSGREKSVAIPFSSGMNWTWTCPCFTASAASVRLPGNNSDRLSGDHDAMSRMVYIIANGTMTVLLCISLCVNAAFGHSAICTPVFSF